MYTRTVEGLLCIHIFGAVSRTITKGYMILWSTEDRCMMSKVDELCTWAEGSILFSFCNLDKTIGGRNCYLYYHFGFDHICCIDAFLLLCAFERGISWIERGCEIPVTCGGSELPVFQSTWTNTSILRVASDLYLCQEVTESTVHGFEMYQSYLTAWFAAILWCVSCTYSVLRSLGYPSNIPRYQLLS